MHVLVTDGEERATLAVVRSLGRHGIRVTVGAERETSLAGSSRFCARRFVYPSPRIDAGAFTRAIEAEIRAGEISSLWPMTDVTTLSLAADRARFAALASLPFPSLDALLAAQDKRRMALAAVDAGIAIPPSYMLNDSDSISEVARAVKYPVVIKPRFSRYFHNGRWESGGVEYAHTAEELLARYDAIHRRIPFPLVQEKIKGEGRGAFLLVWNGQLKSAFCHRRLREKPPWGGVSTLRESLPLDQELVQKSLALLRRLGWQGVAMVEFKMNDATGQPNLMEVNGRFWGSLQLALDAGLDFPFLLHRLLQCEDVAPQLDYKPGVKSRWLLGDLDQLLTRFTHPAMFNGAGSSRLRASFDFLKFAEKDMHYEIESFDDPGPGWFESKSWLAHAFSRLRHGRGGAHAS